MSWKTEDRRPKKAWILGFRFLLFSKYVGRNVDYFEKAKTLSDLLREGFLMNNESENYPIEILLNEFTVKPLLTPSRY